MAQHRNAPGGSILLQSRARAGVSAPLDTRKRARSVWPPAHAPLRAALSPFGSLIDTPRPKSNSTIDLSPSCAAQTRNCAAHILKRFKVRLLSGVSVRRPSMTSVSPGILRQEECMRRERTVWLLTLCLFWEGLWARTPGGYLTVEGERAAR